MTPNALFRLASKQRQKRVMTSIAFGATFAAAVGVVAASPALPCPARPRGHGQVALDDREQEITRIPAQRREGEKIALSAASRHRWIEVTPGK